MQLSRLVVISILVLLLTVSAAGQYTPGTVKDGGGIKGTVTFDGAPPVMKKLNVEKDAKVCDASDKYEETIIVGANGGLRSVVVSIENISSGKAFPEKVTIDQNGCRFEPHVQVVGAGQKLTMFNSDKILHNIHTYGKLNAPINKAQPKFKKRLTLRFDKPETFKITCDVHGWMNGWLVVTEHPYYAVTDENGNFELTEVPPGTYTLKFWHESLGEQTVEITVGASATTTANMKFSS